MSSQCGSVPSKSLLTDCDAFAGQGQALVLPLIAVIALKRPVGGEPSALLTTAPPNLSTLPFVLPPFVKPLPELLQTIGLCRILAATDKIDGGSGVMDFRPRLDLGPGLSKAEARPLAEWSKKLRGIGPYPTTEVTRQQVVRQLGGIGVQRRAPNPVRMVMQSPDEVQPLSETLLGLAWHGRGSGFSDWVLRQPDDTEWPGWF